MILKSQSYYSRYSKTSPSKSRKSPKPQINFKPNLTISQPNLLEKRLKKALDSARVCELPERPGTATTKSANFCNIMFSTERLDKIQQTNSRTIVFY